MFMVHLCAKGIIASTGTHLGSGHVDWRTWPDPSTVDRMSSLHCPQGCGPLTVYISRRGRRYRPYLACRDCLWADFPGADLIMDIWAGAMANAPTPSRLEPTDSLRGDNLIDSVVNSDPYEEPKGDFREIR